MLGCFNGKVLKIRVYLTSFSSSMVIRNVPKWSGSVSLVCGGFWKERNVEYSYNQPSADMYCVSGNKLL